MKNKILFSLGGVVLLFVGAFFIFGQKKVEAEVSPHLSVLSGNLIIKVEVGTLRGNTVYGTLVSTRALSSTEAGGLKFRVYERGGLAPKIIKDNLSVGSISVPVNTNGYDLAITQNSSIPKEWKSLHISCTWDGANFRNVLFNVGTENFEIKDGKTVTCVVRYYTDSQEWIKTMNSAYGEPAVLPVANSALVKAEFKKVILDNSKEYQSDMSRPILDLQEYSYGGNKYLIVLQNQDGKGIISVWDLKDPLNPLFKKDNVFLKTTFSPIPTKHIKLIDNYPYFIVGTNDNTSKDNSKDNRYIRASTSVFKFDVSGTITKVISEGDKHDASQNVIGVVSVVGMFKSGNKVYVARIGGFDQDENCQALIQNKNDSLIYPRYVYFFDVTNGMDGGLPASACVGGWKFPGSFNQASLAHITFINLPYDMFSISSLGKDYVGFIEPAEIHHYHSFVDLMTLLDVTDINNIKPITKGLSGTQLFSDIFSYAKDLAPVESIWIGACWDGTGPYGLGQTLVNSNEKTLIDRIKGTLVHSYEYEEPDYTGQCPSPYTDRVGTVPEGLSKLRMRSYILEANLADLSINSGTKQVLCEHIGERQGAVITCGRITGFSKEDFSNAPRSLLSANNGFVFSANGMTGVMSSSGFGFSDTSAEFDKFFNLIENKNITNRVSRVLRGTVSLTIKEGEFREEICDFSKIGNFCGFTMAVISTIDSKNAVVYAASPFHIEVVKVSLAGAESIVNAEKIPGCGDRTSGFSTTIAGLSCGTAVTKPILPSLPPEIDSSCPGGKSYTTSVGKLCVDSSGAVTTTTWDDGSSGGIASADTTKQASLNASAQTTYDFGSATLKNGSRGEAVKELQRFLNAKLNLGLVVDGKLGPKTIAVIKQWQKDNGLVADGLVGAKTKAKMNNFVH